MNATTQPQPTSDQLANHNRFRHSQNVVWQAELPSLGSKTAPSDAIGRLEARRRSPSVG